MRREHVPTPGARHRAHIKEIRKWVRDTNGKDWVMVKVHRSRYVDYVYWWVGPPDTGTRQVCYGTEHSMMFLDSLREALTAFRHALAQEITDIPPSAMDYTI